MSHAQLDELKDVCGDFYYWLENPNIEWPGAQAEWQTVCTAFRDFKESLLQNSSLDDDWYST